MRFLFPSEDGREIQRRISSTSQSCVHKRERIRRTLNARKVWEAKNSVVSRLEEARDRMFLSLVVLELGLVGGLEGDVGDSEDLTRSGERYK